MKRRNCQEVIAKMVAKIPKSKTKLLKDLKWNFEDAKYKAPEETLQWERTMKTLLKHIPIPTAEWEFKVLSIFTARSIDELKNNATELKACDSMLKSIKKTLKSIK